MHDNRSEFQNELVLVRYFELIDFRLYATQIEKPVFMGFSICVHSLLTDFTDLFTIVIFLRY